MDRSKRGRAQTTVDTAARLTKVPFKGAFVVKSGIVARRSTDMNVGLVLSGGIAKGAYQVGMLKAFRECLPANFFSCISTSSIGAINGYAYLTDQLDRAEEKWRSVNSDGIIGFIRNFSKSSNVDSSVSHLE